MWTYVHATHRPGSVPVCGADSPAPADHAYERKERHCGAHAAQIHVLQKSARETGTMARWTQTIINVRICFSFNIGHGQNSPLEFPTSTRTLPHVIAHAISDTQTRMRTYIHKSAGNRSVYVHRYRYHVATCTVHRRPRVPGPDEKAHSDRHPAPLRLQLRMRFTAAVKVVSTVQLKQSRLHQALVRYLHGFLPGPARADLEMRGRAVAAD